MSHQGKKDILVNLNQTIGLSLPLGFEHATLLMK